MFIVHANGKPVIMKTNRGGQFVAFQSLQDGQAYLNAKGVPCALGTPDEILRLNPRAFPKKFAVLYLSSRRAIELLVKDARDFPTDDYLVTLSHELSPPAEVPAPPARPIADDRQNDFTF